MHSMTHLKNGSTVVPLASAWQPPPLSRAAPATRPVALRARIRSCRAVRTGSRQRSETGDGYANRRVRCFALRGRDRVPGHGTLHAGSRTGSRHDELERFAAKLRATDHVLLEATGNTAAIVNVLRRHVARVAITNPLQVGLSPGPASRRTRSTRPCWPCCRHMNKVSVSYCHKPIDLQISICDQR